MKEVGFDEEEQSFEWAENFYAWVFRGKILLRKYWWIFILTISLGLGYQATQEMQREPSYESQARMIVRGRVAVPEGNVYREELSNFFATESYLMQGPIVKQGARDRVAALRPELKPVPVSIGAAQQPETSIFILRAVGKEPQYTQAYLEAILEEYIKFKRKSREDATEGALLKINEQLLMLEDQIEEQENALVEFQKKNNLIFIDKQGALAATNLLQSKNRMDKLKSFYRQLETMSLEQHLENPAAIGATTDDSTFRGNLLQISESYLSTRRDLDRLKAERDEFSFYMKPRHPKIIALSEEIERTEKLLIIYRRQGLEKLEEQKNILKVQIENLESDIAQLEVTALDYSRRQAEYERLKAQTERSNNTYENLLSTTQSIDVSENLGQETVAILEHATPAYPSSVQLGRKLTQGAVAGFVLGAGLIFLLGMIDNRVMSGDDLSRRFDQPVLGIIPLEDLGENGRVEFLKPKDSRHLFAEACRTLRSSLLFMETGGAPPRSFIVTSAVPGEGKSTISGNLSIAMAFTASKTLLVDADLRRGFLHKHFNLSNSRGLAELIRNECTLKDVTQSTNVENLDFISCGDYPERPGELLLSSRMEELYHEMLDRYEYVIFDSAPVLATDDTTSFATKVDAVLFTVRAGYTQARQVRSSLERLRQRGSNVCGFILNFVDTKGSDYYYYNKYSNYYYAESGKSANLQIKS